MSQYQRLACIVRIETDRLGFVRTVYCKNVARRVA